MSDTVNLVLAILNIILIILQVCREIKNIIKAYISYKIKKEKNKPIDWEKSYKIFNECINKK